MAKLLLFLSLICLGVKAAVYDISGNAILNGQLNDPNMFYPLLNTTTTPGYSGVFTFTSMKPGVTDLTKLSTCQGVVYKTWDTAVINSTALGWQAVGVLGGYCYGDWIKYNYGPNGYIGYTNGSIYNNITSRFGPPIITFGASFGSNVSFTTSVKAIQFGAHKFFDILIFELNITNAQLIAAYNPRFYSVVASEDEIVYAYGVSIISSTNYNLGNDIYPRYTTGTRNYSQI